MKQNPNTIMPEKLYSVYTARVSQTGTSDPTWELDYCNIVINGVKLTGSWTRNSTGIYYLRDILGTLEWVPSGRMMSFIGITTPSFVIGARINATTYSLRTYNTAGTLADGILGDASVEIRRYREII